MLSFKTWLSTAGLLLLACGSEARPPATPETPNFLAAFSNLPFPPAPQLVSRSGSTDALQLTLRSPADVSSVTDYYRSALSKGNWRLVSDSKNRDGSIVLYAEQKGPPLWVRIWKPAEGGGSMVQLTGAVPSKNAGTTSSRTDTSTKKR
jgi:hypothetical protein